MRALLVVLLVVVMVAAGCSGDDDDTASDAGSTTVAPTTVTEDATTSTSVEAVEVSTTTVPPAEVIEGAFTFAEDDLCAWVSEVEVAEFVTAAFDDPNVTAVFEGAAADRYRAAGEPEDPDSCQWTLTSTAGDVGDLLAGNASITWVDTSGNARHYREMEVADFNEYLGFVEIGSAVSGHPSLSDGVVVHNGAFRRYTFWVPPSDEYLRLSVGPDAGVYDTDDPEARIFGVADRFVQELGWLG